MKRIVLLFLAVCPLFAGEYAVLQSGFRIYADRHESIEGMTRLHIGSGTMDLPSAGIREFEVEEYVRPAPEVQPSPALAEPASEEQAALTPRELVELAALKHGLRPEFVRSVAAAESAFRPEAISHKGAIGLMQLMPGTANELGVNPYNPAENAEGGAKYLRQLLLRYKDSPDPVRLALAAYNAGPGAVDRYRNIPPYRETQLYVERVLRKYLAELNR